jgi:polysaccharide export outer membrane protein/exopolysaccharide production protein ExoF
MTQRKELRARDPRLGGARPATRWHCGLLAILLLASVDGVAAAGEYVLGPQDTVRVLVYEWRASKDEIFEWTALNDEFTVSAAGTISLPLVGEIPAAGSTTGEVERKITEQLQKGLGLGRRPATAVEIVKYRPVYIVGHVDRPGEFPYRPGLTVLQALSVAGGLRRVNDPGLLRFEREAIGTRGELTVLRQQVSSLIARRARLEAELKQFETVEFPRELTRRREVETIALIMQQEQQIFDARREAFSTQVRALEQLKSHLEKEVPALAAQLEIEDTQIRLVKKELDTVSSLVDKGLAVTPRQLSLERTVAQIEGERIRVGTALLRAKQEISKTEIALLEVTNKRKTDVALELRETQSKLDDLYRKADTSEQLLFEAEVTAPQLALRIARARLTQPTYTIVRNNAGSAVEIVAAETTAIQPDDTVKVELPTLLDESTPGSFARRNEPPRSSRLPQAQAESRDSQQEF